MSLRGLHQYINIVTPLSLPPSPSFPVPLPLLLPSSLPSLKRHTFYIAFVQQWRRRGRGSTEWSTQGRRHAPSHALLLQHISACTQSKHILLCVFACVLLRVAACCCVLLRVAAYLLACLRACLLGYLLACLLACCCAHLLRLLRICCVCACVRCVARRAFVRVVLRGVR